MSSPQDVALFGQELQKIVQFLGVSEGQMQMGHMRFEPNINVHITDQDGRFTRPPSRRSKTSTASACWSGRRRTKSSGKSANGKRPARSARRAPTAGTKPAGTTFLQRDKEEANDYRYFPDPDLVPVEVDEAWLAELKSQIGELPAARRKRYVEALGLSAADAAMLAGDRATGEFYEAAIAAGGDAKRVANLILSHGRRIANEKSDAAGEIGITPARFAEVAKLIDAQQNCRQQRRRDLRQAR